MISSGAISSVDAYARTHGGLDNASFVELRTSPAMKVNADAVVAGAEVNFHSTGGFLEPGPSRGADRWMWLGKTDLFVRTGSFHSNMGSFTHQVFNSSSGAISVADASLCISTDAGTAGDSCGAPVDFSAGAYKFSFFGYSGSAQGVGTMGCDVLVNGQSASHFVVRLLVNLTSLGADSAVDKALFNGGSTLATLGKETLKNVSVVGRSHSFAFSFPDSFIAGTYDALKPSNLKVRPVLIYAQPNGADPSHQSFFIDFLIEMTEDMKSCHGFFVYDPTVITNPYYHYLGQSASGSYYDAGAATTARVADQPFMMPGTGPPIYTSRPTTVSGTRRASFQVFAALLVAWRLWL